ncbi:putative G-protein coupled receptor 101 [Trichoplax sp. H2]|nr:putative G-protein coupled receptor 101 [Trichoplax sp. H2]|eukprot:RDD39570.1 putative G-protein coupled receptor 101 [Trichoplax sp. H2]
MSDPPWIHSSVKVTLLAVVLLVSLMLNLPVLLAFVKKPQIIEDENRYRFIRTQVVINLVCTVLSLPLSIAVIAANRWPFGWIFCSIYGYSHQFFALLCIAIVAIISIDRYIAIALPYRHTFRFTTRKSNIAIVLTALICAILSLPSLLIRIFIVSPTFETCTFYYPVYCQGTPEDYNCINITNSDNNSFNASIATNFNIRAIFAYSITCTCIYYVIPFIFIIAVHGYILVIANRHRRPNMEPNNSQTTLINHQGDKRTSLFDDNVSNRINQNNQNQDNNSNGRPRTYSDSSVFDSQKCGGRKDSNTDDSFTTDADIRSIRHPSINSIRRPSINSIRRSISRRKQSIVSNVSMIRLKISRHKAAKSLVYVSSAFALCLTGYFVVLILDMTCTGPNRVYVSNDVKFITYFLMSLTFLVNPIIYAYSSKNIVKEIKRLLKISDNKVSPSQTLASRQFSQNAEGRRLSIPADISCSDNFTVNNADMMSKPTRIPNVSVTGTRPQRTPRIESNVIKPSLSGGKLQDLPENEELKLTERSEKIFRSVSFSFGDAATINAKRQRAQRMANSKKGLGGDNLPSLTPNQPNLNDVYNELRPRAATFVFNDDRRSSNTSTVDDDCSSTATLLKREAGGSINGSFSSWDNENDGVSSTSTDRSTTTLLPLVSVSNERNTSIGTTKTLNIEDLKTPSRKALSLQPLMKS